MPKFGRQSRKQLASCDERLQRVCNRAIEVIDFSVICGHRAEADQEEAYREGKSQLPWPYSEHNERPSRAADIVPYPIDWDDRERFHFLAGVIKAVAFIEGIPLTWGGDWNKFQDLPHWQIADGK
ncbi:MAG: M15 family metallopeptidase [bacterium]|nr:M15 family metallopeptidase [bacterium]